MVPCGRCGANVADDAPFCPTCGVNRRGGPPPAPAPNTAPWAPPDASAAKAGNPSPYGAGYGPPGGPGSAPGYGPGGPPGGGSPPTYGAPFPPPGFGPGGYGPPVWQPAAKPTSSNRLAVLLVSGSVIAVVIVLVVAVSVLGSSSKQSKFSQITPYDPSLDDPFADPNDLDQTRPRARQDHWHVAFDVYLCDHVVDPLTDKGPDRNGVHTHGEGIIHIHPFTSAAAGERATFGLFADQVGLRITPNSIRLPDGTTRANGDDCNGRPGHWVMKEWVVDQPGAPPETSTTDFDLHRFRGDRHALTLAFVADDADVPQPESIPLLDQLSDVPRSTTTRRSATSGSSSTTGRSGTTRAR